MSETADSAKRVIEINGAKFEVDLRHAVRVDHIKVGDRVKVLLKSYGDSYRVYHGVVVGFEPFQSLPTIVVAYMELSYAGCDVKFISYNSKTPDIEIVAAIDDDVLAMDKAEVIASMNKAIETHKAEIEKIEEKKRYFLTNFTRYWAETAISETVED